MDYAEVILKLVNDMIKLEQRVGELELTVDELMDYNEVSETVNSDSERKSFSKNEIIAILKSKGTEVEIEVEKASMSDGGGVITKYKNQKPKKVMLKSSRNYSDGDVEFIGWHTLPVEALENYDAYIFTVAHKEDIELFIFTPEELKTHVLDKIATNSNGSKMYHFSFAKDKEGNYIDCREPDNVKPVSKYNNNWVALK